MKISIIDTETTGLSPEEGKVIEVAVVNFNTALGDVTESRSFLICDEVEPYSILQEQIKKTLPIHGIELPLVVQHGFSLFEAQSMVSDMIAGSEAILAHNAEFDRQWLEFDTFVPEEKWVCTQDDIKWPRESVSKSLVAVALAHGVGVVSAHRAMEDCMTIARLLKRVYEMDKDLSEMIRHGMRPKANFKAIVSYDDRELAKKAGFRWDGQSKTWSRKMAIEDAQALDFKVIQI